MIPDRLTANGFVALIRQWRDMWNNQLRDHLHRSRIVAGTGIRVQHTASGTIVSALKASGGGVNAPVETSGELIIGVVVSALYSSDEYVASSALASASNSAFIWSSLSVLLVSGPQEARIRGNDSNAKGNFFMREV